MYETFQREKRRGIRLSTMQKLALMFLAVIFIGGFLLWLPFSNQNGHIAFIDALFTSTTSVCVTGLVTVTPVTQFTLFGKIIILLLIQIGGLGVIACSTIFFILIGKKITVRERVVIQETYNLDTLTGMVFLIIRIIKLTFIIEGIGAVFFAIQFIPEYGIVGIWYAIFHSVSAFCNAGIDILGDNSFIDYVNNPLINLTTMALIVAGGLGFTVWFDVFHNIRNLFNRKSGKRHFFRRLTFHSKIVITMTAVLLIGGTWAFLLLEWNNFNTIGGRPVWEKVMISAFQSVTTRTAGFATVNQSALKPESAFISCLLMFIGGSPAGTAGGVKTTTVAMLILTCFTVLKGCKDTEAFGRKIPDENIKTGICIIIVSFTSMLLGIVFLNMGENLNFLDTMFEVNSALGTVGLTRNITPVLSTMGKIVDMMLMYIGRIGPITLALAFGFKRGSTDALRELPTKRIMVG